MIRIFVHSVNSKAWITKPSQLPIRNKLILNGDAIEWSALLSLVSFSIVLKFHSFVLFASRGCKGSTPNSKEILYFLAINVFSIPASFSFSSATSSI